MKNEFLNVLKSYELKYFYHFSNISNLESILVNGICNRKYMDANNIKYVCSDYKRLDNQLNCVSLSLNNIYKSMFWSKSNTLVNDWVLFELDAYKIIERFYANIYYCKYNASSNSVIKMLETNKEYLKSLSAFKNIFDNGRASVNAELLVEGIIPVDFVLNIYVSSLQLKLIVMQLLYERGLNIPVIIKREMF